MKFPTLLLAVLVSTLPLAAQEVHNYNLVFKPGQTKLNNDQKKQLQVLAQHLDKNESVIVYPLINYGAATSHGAARAVRSTGQIIYRYDKKAKIQANAIAEYCKTIDYEVLGIPANFPSAYRGYSVSVNLKFVGGTSPLARKKPGTLQSRYPVKPSQFFVIDPTKDTLIVGNEGTKLLFEAGSLKSDKPVKVELKEYYGLADYMKGGFPTVSDGKMIETGGTIYLNAKEDTPDAKPVRINQDKGIAVDFTLGADDPDMQIFVPDPQARGEMNWVLPRTSSWKMTKTITDYDGTVTKLVFTSRVEWEAYLEKERLKAAREAAERRRLAVIAAKKAEIRDRMQSKLRVYNLGMINCDKFPSAPQAPLQLATTKPVAGEYYLVFKEVRGVMTGSPNANGVSFNRVPKGRTATLFVVTFDEDQAFLYEREITPNGKRMALNIELKAVDQSYLNSRLERFN